MSDCKSNQELISRLLDEELTESEKAALAEHLAGCRECSALYQAFSAVSGAIQEDLEEPPEALHENIMAELRRGEIKKKNRLSRPVRAALATAACAVLVIAAAAGVLPNLRMGRTAASYTMSADSAASAVQPREAEEKAKAAPAEAVAEEADEAPVLREAPSAGAADLEASSYQYSMDAAVDAAEETVWTLPENWDLDALLALLDGQPAGDLQLTPEQVYTLLTTADGAEAVLTLYRQGTDLYYNNPADSRLYRTNCDIKVLESALFP